MARLSGCRTLATALILAALPAFAGDKGNNFNDENYQPRGAYNSLPPPARTSVKAGNKTSVPAPASKPVKVSWQWDSHRFSNPKNKKGQGHSGVFYYRVVNQRIDTGSLCDNYNKGSLIYRDCRKAAKQHFNEQCSSRFAAACAAAGMAP